MSRYNSNATNTKSDRIDRRYRSSIDWQYWPDVSGQRQYADTILDPATMSRPDIEDDALIAWGLAQSEASKNQNVKIDLLLGEGINLSTYHSYITDSQLMMQTRVEIRRRR